MPGRLAGKRIVITGATGMAEAGAHRFSAEGANVFVISIDESDCQSLVESISAHGGTADWKAADLTNESAAVEAFETAVDMLHGIDGLYAVVGGSGRRFGDGPLHEVPLDGWTSTLELNGHPPFLAARQAVQAMLDQASGGSIVLISSVLATSPSPAMFSTHAYAAIKGAEISLARSMAAYYAPSGIRVNVVAPGLVRTPMARRAADDPEIVAFAAAKQPLAGGLLDPGDVAATAAFLLSDEARVITGQSIAVDGGWGVTDLVRTE